MPADWLTDGMPGTHITRLPTTSGGLIDAKVVEGGREEARRWHNVIQPLIATTDRLDRHWNWPRLVDNFGLLERLALRNTAYLQINVADPNGNAVPVGQVFVSDGFPYFPRHREPCVFLWYLAAAPAAALRANQVPSDLKLLRPLIDLALQFSFQRGYLGRLTLHAATSGDRAKDDVLCAKYEKARLIPIKKSRFVSWFRRNDGRYFHADEQRALDLSEKLDNLR